MQGNVGEKRYTWQKMRNNGFEARCNLLLETGYLMFNTELGMRFFLRFTLALSRSLAELFALFFGP